MAWQRDGMPPLVLCLPALSHCVLSLLWHCTDAARLLLLLQVLRELEGQNVVMLDGEEFYMTH